MTQSTAPAGAVNAALAEAFAHHRAGRLQKAEAGYRRALEAAPEHPDALHLLGVVARQSKRPDAAVQLIRQAIAVMPDVPEFHANLGNAI